MTLRRLPPREQITVCFAHAAYRMQERFALRNTVSGLLECAISTQSGAIAAAAVDCVWEEPLPSSSPLWSARNLFITSHTAGETQKYEDNVIDLLLENLERQWLGESELKNGLV